MSAPNAYPLCWPAGWPRTETQRERSKFKTTLPSALSNLKHQIELMGGKSVLLSSNYTLACENPKDPGVVAYFEWSKMPMAIPCDRWDRIESNVQAIALTVEAMRGMDRWGAKHMIRAMFTGFKQLPMNTNGESWWTVLGVPEDSKVELVRGAYNRLVKESHPDRGGDHERFIKVQRAWEEFEKNTEVTHA